MKKVLALFSTLLIFAGLKAQTPSTAPSVKKETVKPGNIQSAAISDSARNVQHKQVSHKDIKFDQVKKATVVQMKETPAAKPQKH